MDSEKCTCPGCDNRYKMQSPAELARPENPNPKWPVPQDLIELQPSYAQVVLGCIGEFCKRFPCVFLLSVFVVSGPLQTDALLNC